MSLTPGSKRHARADIVKATLSRYPNGLRYDQLAKVTGLSHAAVCRAVDDLQYETNTVVGIPAPRNDYRVTLDWKQPAIEGESNQARHNATRLERQSIRLEKAGAVESSMDRAAMLRMAASTGAAYAQQLRILADIEPLRT